MRAFLREFLTGIGGPPAAPERLRVAAWVRLLLVAPVIVAPTAVVHASYAARGHGGARLVAAAWSVQIAAWLVANVVLLAATAARPRIARLLTYLSVAAELGSNQLSAHAIGTLAGHGPLYILIVVATYRVFFDWRLGAFAAAAGCCLYVAFAALELGGALPPHPYMPGTFVHPVYADRVAAANVVFMVVAGVLIAFFAVNYGVNQSVKLHRYITESVLRRYLAPSLVARAARGELRLDAAPERRIVTVLFTDLVGFTTLSERLGADDVGRLLNRYLSTMADVAHAHGATVDKFVGDAVMIVFGAPDPLEPHEQARRCLALARALRAALPGVDPEARLTARTGINTGEAVVGNFGSLARSDYTVVGPAVNVAARLESAARPGGILMGEATARLLDGDAALEPAGDLTLRGVSRPVRAFYAA